MTWLCQRALVERTSCSENHSAWRWLLQTASFPRPLSRLDRFVFLIGILMSCLNQSSLVAAAVSRLHRSASPTFVVLVNRLGRFVYRLVVVLVNRSDLSLNLRLPVTLMDHLVEVRCCLAGCCCFVHFAEHKQKKSVCY